MRGNSTVRLVAATCAAVVALCLVAVGCGGSDSGGGSAETSTDITIKASGAPTSGGSVRFATEAESDGFNPTTNRWAISGHMVGSAIFDPLAAYDENGKA